MHALMHAQAHSKMNMCIYNCTPSTHTIRKQNRKEKMWRELTRKPTKPNSFTFLKPKGRATHLSHTIC